MTKSPRSRPDAGTSLVELLASMAILAFLLLVLSSALGLSLGQFRIGVDRSESLVGTQAATDWIRRDFQSIVSERYGNLPALPDSVTEEQREFFGGKMFFPVEINRTAGQNLDPSRSFVNAHPNFGSVAFFARLPIDAQFSIDYEKERRGDGSAPERALSQEAIARVALVGYYVAYTYESPLAGERRAAMRLHRHYRPGENHLAQGYAAGFALHCSREINDGYDETGSGEARPRNQRNPARLRNGIFANREQPFVFSRFVDDPRALNASSADQPWPKFPVERFLESPPPVFDPDRGSAADWEDRHSPVHDIVFPDEPIAHNVVRFEVEAFREVHSPGGLRVMNAHELAAHLGLPDEDWPCLATPSFVDITISVVKESAARQLLAPEDWLVDWTKTNPSDWSATRRLIEANLETFRMRIPISPFPG